MKTRHPLPQEMKPARQRRSWLWLGLAAVVLALAGTHAAYQADMHTIQQRLNAGSRMAATSHGPMEYADLGSGPAVLVLHGAGGGHDQGASMAQAYGGEGFRWIVPSRFGYLRTPLPADASTAAQADALLELLDGLGLRRVAVLAMSGGVPPALQIASRHPTRVSALVLLSSAPYTPLSARQQQLPMPDWMYQALFSSDFPYWLLQKAVPSSLQAIFDARAELRAGQTPEERAFVEQLVGSFLPVTQRMAGLGNEGAAVNPQARYSLERIVAPALVIHARDDGINPFAFGEHTARFVPGAQFMPLETGGHLLLGHTQAVRMRVNAFLRSHAAASS
jgi:2-hydroxy-6-oxonona-2,4-dienedioate hydrolase